MKGNTSDDNPILMEADPEIAKKHGDSYVLHDAIGRPLNIFTSTPSDFGENGIGLEMYFIFMKQNICLFIILTIISSPVLVINYLGSYLQTAQLASFWADSTIANQKGIPIFTTNITDAEAAIESQKAVMFTTISLDILNSFVFLIFICFVGVYNSRLLQKTSNVMPGDYAVQVSLSKGSFATEDSIYKFFSKFGVIHECNLPLWFGRKLQIANELTILEMSIKDEEKKGIAAGGNKQLEILEDKKNTLIQELCEIEKTSLVLNTAFVIFESRDEKEACLRAYAPFINDLEKEPDNLRYEGKALIVIQAPEPREIFWENMGVNWGLWRPIVSYTTITILILGSFFWVSVITRIEIKLPSFSMCAEDDPNVDVTNLTSSSQDVACFCGGIPETQVYNDPNYSVFCSQYDEEFYKIWILRLLCITGVSVINLLLKYAIMGNKELKIIRIGKIRKIHFQHRRRNEKDDKIIYFSRTE